MKRKINPKVLRVMYAAGIPVGDIAAHFDVTQYAIYRRVSRLRGRGDAIERGVCMKWNAPVTWTLETEDELASRWNSGQSAPEIAKAMGKGQYQIENKIQQMRNSGRALARRGLSHDHQGDEFGTDRCIMLTLPREWADRLEAIAALQRKTTHRQLLDLLEYQLGTDEYLEDIAYDARIEQSSGGQHDPQP